MARISVTTNGLGCWPDVAEKPVIDLLGDGAAPIRLALIKARLGAGASSVRLRLDLPDGTIVLTEVTLDNLVNAARVFELADRHVRGGPKR